MVGGILCLSGVNFNLCFKFRTIKDRDYTFGTHTSILMPFQRTQKVTVTLTFRQKNSLFGLL